LAGLACTLGAQGGETELDAARQTVEAELTLTAAANPVVVATETPAGEATATLAVVATDAGPPTVTVSVDTNCRSGPGEIYKYAGALLVGETGTVLAINSTETYAVIENPDGPGDCWLWLNFATIVGDTSELPLATPPPTPLPEFEFSFQSGECVWSVIDLIFLVIENTGPVAFESYSLYSENVTQGGGGGTESDNDGFYAFFPPCDGPGGERIEPGQTGYLLTAGIAGANSGDTFSFTLKLCTLQNQSGYCLEKSGQTTYP
jgi:hypothetical protein